MAENEQANVKFGIDVEDLNKGINRINKALSETEDGVKNLDKGFMRIKSNGTASIKQTTKVIENMTQRMKEMSLQLKNIQNQYAGSFKALERQAALRGTKTGSLSDNKIWAAQIEKLNVQNKSLVDTYSNVARKIDLVNVKMNALTGSYARQRAEISRYQNQLLFGTREGQDAINWRNRLKADKIQAEAVRERLANKGISTTAIQDASQMESLDRRLGAIQLKLMANYKAINMVTGAFRYLLNYTVEYDKELHQLQAIAAVSDTTMNQLKNSIQAVASSTKFTSLEVAQAGTVLAQAGLSAKQIETTLPAIAKLATATGTDLATSTDVITSTLNVYSLQASEAEHVTNALTTAMNESKADIAGFQKAIQYAGNYAAQLGVTYEETAAVISAATQAGIRSRSMLGTGLRAVLAEFLNPTKKLTAQLEKVGLTIDDIDVRSKGLTNVLKTLKESGFGATEAFRGMERRGAAFLASIINQTEFIDTLRDHMASSTAAAEANEIQMDSLSAQIDNLKSIMGTAASDGVAPFSKALTGLLKVINNLLSGGATKGEKPSMGGGIFTSLLFGTVGSASVLTSLSMIGTAIVTITNQIKALNAVANAGGFVKFLGFISSWKGLGIVSVLMGIGSAAIYAADKLGLFTSGADKAKGTIEELGGNYEEAKEKGTALASMFERLYNQREKLQNQTERDIFLKEILSRFPEAAQFVDKLTLSFEELVSVLTKLEALNAGEQAEKAAEVAQAAVRENFKIVKQLGEQYFGDAKQIGFGSEAYMESTNYNNLINRLQKTEAFKNLDYDYLLNRRRVSTFQGGLHLTESGQSEASARYQMQGLYNQIRGMLDFNTSDAKGLLQQYGKLVTASRTIGGEEGKALTAVIKQLGDEVNKVAEAITSGENKISSEIRADFSDQLAASQAEYAKLTADAREVGKQISEEIKKTGADNEKSVELANMLLEDYRQERDKLASMEEVIRTPDGSRKDIRDYSLSEMAKYLGQPLENIKAAFDKYTNQGISDEKHVMELISQDFDRNNKLDSIRTYMEVIRMAIERSGRGTIDFKRQFTDEDYQNALKALQAIPNAKNAKQATQLGNQYLTNMGYSKRWNVLNAASSGMTSDQYGKFINKLPSGVFSQKDPFQAISKAYSEATGQTLSESSDLAKQIKTEINTYNAAINTQKKALEEYNANAPKTVIADATTGMDSFFHKLNVDIKEIDTAYTNATRSMDRMLAAQQGVVAGLERFYGSGSVAVKAEQNRLADMEKAQLGQRTSALEAKRAGYQRQLEILQGNPEYQKAKESYDRAYANWKAAEKTGDQRTINQTYKDLKEVSKGWDKLASKNDSLISEIAKLDDEIQKNTQALYEEREERRLERENPGGQITKGFGDAATNYLKDAEAEGYGTIRGEAGLVGKSIIDSMDNGLVTFLDNVTSKSMTAKESFKEFGKSIIQTIGDIARQLVAKQIVMSILGAFTGGGDVQTSGGGSASGWSSNALGGLVTGPIKNRDSVPTMLMPGEYVLKKSAVDSLGRDYLDGLNNKSSAYMTNYSSDVTEAKAEGQAEGTSQPGGVVNVYVVGQEQQEQMTPQDVLVTITQDMMTGGQTKKLVKSIAMGAM